MATTIGFVGLGTMVRPTAPRCWPRRATAPQKLWASLYYLRRRECQGSPAICYRPLNALVISFQRAPAAAPAPPPTAAPMAGLPPTMAPRAAPPAAPAAPPLKARCCVGVIFAHPTMASNATTRMRDSTRFIAHVLLIVPSSRRGSPRLETWHPSPVAAADRGESDSTHQSAAPHR